MCLFISSTLASKYKLVHSVKVIPKKTFGCTSLYSEAPISLLINTHFHPPVKLVNKDKDPHPGTKDPCLPSSTPFFCNEWKGVIKKNECRLAKWSVYGGINKRKSHIIGGYVEESRSWAEPGKLVLGNSRCFCFVGFVSGVFFKKILSTVEGRIT